MDVTLREITDGNRDAVLALSVTPAQVPFVGSVRDALEDAVEYAHAKPWYRAVYAGDQPVGFVVFARVLDAAGVRGNSEQLNL